MTVDVKHDREKKFPSHIVQVTRCNEMFQWLEVRPEIPLHNNSALAGAMKNSIDAHVEFSFKGESYSLSATIDLDDFQARETSRPSLHAILARKHGIDTYSYLYEVMEEEEIRFDNPQGLAADFFTAGEFDLEAFVARMQELKTLDLLQAIATQELGIDNLAQRPEIQKALFQAYELGRTHHAN